MKKIGFKFLVAVLCVVIGVASIAMAEEHTHNYGGWNVKTAAIEGTVFSGLSFCFKPILDCFEGAAFFY